MPPSAQPAAVSTPQIPPLWLHEPDWHKHAPVDRSTASVRHPPLSWADLCSDVFIRQVQSKHNTPVSHLTVVSDELLATFLQHSTVGRGESDGTAYAMGRGRMLNSWGLVFLAALASRTDLTLTVGLSAPRSEAAANDLFDRIYLAASKVTALASYYDGKMSVSRADAAGHLGILSALRHFDSVFLVQDSFDEDTQFRNITWKIGCSAHKLLELLDTAGGRRGKPAREILLQWKAQIQARRGDDSVDQHLVAAIHNEYCKPTKFALYLNRPAHAGTGTDLLLEELGTDDDRGMLALQEAGAGVNTGSVGESRFQRLGLGTSPNDVSKEEKGSDVISLFKEAHFRNIYDADAICESGIIPELRGKTPNPLHLMVGKDPPCWLCPDKARGFADQEEITREDFIKLTGGPPGSANLPHKRGLIIKHQSFKCPFFRNIVKSFLITHPSHIGMGVFAPIDFVSWNRRVSQACTDAGQDTPQ